MENKILLQDLSAKLSQKKRLSARESDAFLKVFFETISEYVIKDKIVKVKGLGTFKLIDVLDRESVNVNTGERFVIPGHSKISFTPDAELKNKVNKPFELFQTVVINEGTSLEEMERIDDNVEVDEEEVELTNSLVKQIDSTKEDAFGVADDVAAESETPAIPVVSAVQLVESVSVAAPDHQSQEKSAVKPKPVYVAPSSVEPESVETDSVNHNVVDESAPKVESDSASVSSSETVEHTNETSSAEKSDDKPVTIIKEVVVSGPVRLASSCKMCFMTLLCVMMILSYIAGKYDVLSPLTNCIVNHCAELSSNPSSKDASPAQTTDPVVKKEESAKKEKPVAKPEPPKENIQEMAAKYDQLEGGKYLIVGTKSVRIMKRGDNLFMIARDELGNKELMPYIVVHNKFKNPDNVPLDAEVKIPDLREIK